jgi:hypothetical protein
MPGKKATLRDSLVISKSEPDEGLKTAYDVVNELNLSDVGSLKIVPTAFGTGEVRLGRCLCRVHEAEGRADVVSLLNLGKSRPVEYMWC